jgi:hypothetical protein
VTAEQLLDPVENAAPGRDGQLLPCHLEHQRPEQVHRRYAVQPMPRVIVGSPVDKPGNNWVGRVQPGTGHVQPGQDARSRRSHHDTVLDAGPLVAAQCA